MPNLDPWVNQNSNSNEDIITKTIYKFENHLLSIKAEHLKRIQPNLHPTYKVIKISFGFGSSHNASIMSSKCN